MRLWLKVQAGIWPAPCLESLHPTLRGSKSAVVNAHQEMFWGWSIFTEIKVESTDVKQAIGVAISQWLHSSMCFVSEGNNSHKNMYSETCIKLFSLIKSFPVFFHSLNLAISICNFHVCRKISLRTADIFPVVRRERSDDRKYVCSPQPTERWNRAEYNSYVIDKKLGVIRWPDCPCEIIWKLHFSSPSKQFLYVLFFFLPSVFPFLFSSFILFSYLVAPLSVLSFQAAEMFRSWSPYKIFKPLFLIHMKPLLSTFSLYFSQRNS